MKPDSLRGGRHFSSRRALAAIGFAMLSGACAPRFEAVAAEAVAKEESAAIPVRLASVYRGAIDLPIRVAGTIGPVREVALSFKTTGIVKQVLVREGERVHKGQLLVVVDAQQLDAQRRQASEALDKAMRDLDRASKLQAQGSLPVVSELNAKTDVSIRKAELASSSFAVSLTRLVAPEDGVITRRTVEVGEVVGPSQSVLRLSASGDGPVARIALTDRDVMGVRLGTPASVVLDVRPNEPLVAHITQIAPAASPDTGTFATEVSIDDPSARTLPTGLSVKVLIARVTANGTSIPAESLVDGAGEHASVYAVSSGHARRVPVRVRALSAGRAVIESGLEDLELVVESGAALLRDGASVNVLP